LITPSAELDALAAQAKSAPVERDMFGEMMPEDSEWETFENDYPDIVGPIKAKLDEITARLDTMCRAFVRHYGQFGT
jgi:hypothetical protein